MSRSDAAFFTETGGSELLWESADKKVCVYKNGEMRVHYGDRVLRYTNDLIANGIDSDERLEEALEKGIIDFVDNPWFEVVWADCEDGVVHHNYEEAVAYAEKVELGELAQ